MELAEDRDKLEFEREHPINVEPLRPDVIVIKKPPGTVLRQEIAGIFRGRNIIEFKSPEDSLTVSDYMRAFSYPCVYQREVNVSYRDITLTLVRDVYPRELMKYLKAEVKREVEEKSPGVFIVKGEMFPVQVIVGKRLPENENIWIKNLN
ncbi:MAG: 3-isopropylmalate dehydrogenase, partial [Clostridiales bacterium]|nr:3-isopropylmalate dehydrogenase [Clostridiales bacterium]